MAIFVTMKPAVQFLYWSFVGLLFTIVFGWENSDFMQSLYFVCMLLPVTLVTAYFISEVLFPKYLFQQRFSKLILYLTYTFIISIYIQFLVQTGAFVLFANYQYNNLNPISVDVFKVSVMMYLAVAIFSLIKLYVQYMATHKELDDLLEKINKHAVSVLNIKVDRKNIPVNIEDIIYIESLSDYVHIYTNGNAFITREKISHLEARLDTRFLRTHRSFLINTSKITGYHSESISIGELELPIGRTYKKAVRAALG